MVVLNVLNDFYVSYFNVNFGPFSTFSGTLFTKKIPLKSYVDFSVVYYIKTSVVALFSVNLVSVKVMHHCNLQPWGKNPLAFVWLYRESVRSSTPESGLS